ncbi:MerR family transcriptional regulator [bacterium]|jgi:excisionase family DNA binding protein|nr:MerR family transcriptional regulator [bacterium]
MTNEKGFITIKEASTILGVSKDTLRRWDIAGKLKTIRHPMNNYRIYNPDDISKLKQDILRGKSE